MRTTFYRYLKIALLAVLMLNLAACEVEIRGFYDDDTIGGGYYNRSKELCSRTWVSNYWNANGNFCRQELDFYLDRTGVDYVRIEYPGGKYEDIEYHFKWSWENDGQTSLRMYYGAGDTSYLDNIYIGNNRLTGYLDGRNNYVEYIGKR